MNGIRELSIGGIGVLAIGYGLVHYALIGQEVGQRIGRAEHLTACKQQHVAWVREHIGKRLSKLKKPRGSRELAMLRSAQNSPWMKIAKGMSTFGLRPGQANPLDSIVGNPFKLMQGAGVFLEAKHRRAVLEYNSAVAKIKEAAKYRVAKSGASCEQAILDAVAARQQDWAVYSGTVGLIKPASIKNFRRDIKVQLKKNASSLF